jgi:uncharacterized protein
VAGAVAYLDTSAFVKLIVVEPESSALRRAITRWPQHVSSTLLRTETVRALLRSGNTGQIPAARRLLRAVRMIRVDEPLLDRAADLEPGELCTLDAVHLASARVMIAYDIRLKAAAQAYGLVVDRIRVPRRSDRVCVTAPPSALTASSPGPPTSHYESEHIRAHRTRRPDVSSPT